MRHMTHTIVDTIHLLALSAVICLLFALVISREEPAWSDFTWQSVAVLAAAVVLARIISWSGRRPRHT
jgi:hypothetical protein